MTAHVFLSKDKLRFISTNGGSPCFLATSHYLIGRELGVDLNDLENVTADFYYNGKGKSINEFLNKNLD